MAKTTFGEKANEIDNTFANVMLVADNIKSAAVDVIDKYAKPQQAKAEILKMVRRIEQKLEGIK